MAWSAVAPGNRTPWELVRWGRALEVSSRTALARSASDIPAEHRCLMRGTEMQVAAGNTGACSFVS